MVIITSNARFVVAFPYISLIVGLNSDFIKMIRIIANHYGVEFLIVNTINNEIDNEIDIQINKRLKY